MQSGSTHAAPDKNMNTIITHDTTIRRMGVSV